MAAFKIVFFFIVVEVVNSKPLLFKEMNVKKNFEFSVKPIVFKPIAFIKEKWSPLGHFGMKHAIVKRSPFEIAPAVMPTNHEHVASPLIRVSLDKSLDAMPPVLPALPHPAQSEIDNEVSHTMDLQRFPVLPPELLNEEVPVSELTKLPPPHHKDQVSPVGALPVSPILLPPLEANERLSRLPLGVQETNIPPFSPVSPLPAEIQEGIIPASSVGIPGFAGQGNVPESVNPPPVGIPGSSLTPRGTFLTDIARVDEINSYLKAVDALPIVKPPLEENILPMVPGNSIEAEGQKDSATDSKFNTSSLVKGSRMALYFGNILLQVMSEVISSARSAISQYSKPATI